MNRRCKNMFTSCLFLRLLACLGPLWLNNVSVPFSSELSFYSSSLLPLTISTLMLFLLLVPLAGPSLLHILCAPSSTVGLLLTGLHQAKRFDTVFLAAPPVRINLLIMVVAKCFGNISVHCGP